MFNFQNGTKAKKLFVECQAFVENNLISELNSRLSSPRKSSPDPSPSHSNLNSAMHATDSSNTTSDSENDDLGPLQLRQKNPEARNCDESPRNIPVFVTGACDTAPMPGLVLAGQPVGLPVAAAGAVSELMQHLSKLPTSKTGNFQLVPASEIKLKNPNWESYVMALSQDIIAPALTGSRLDDSISANEYFSELSHALVEETGDSGLEFALTEVCAARPISVLFIFLPSIVSSAEILVKGAKDTRDTIVLPESLEYQPQYLGVRPDVDLGDTKSLQGTRISLVYRISTRPASLRGTRPARFASPTASSRTLSYSSLKLAETSSIGSKGDEEENAILPVDPEDPFDVDMLILNATLGSDMSTEEDTDPTPAVEEKGFGPVMYVPSAGAASRNIVSYATIDGLISVLTEQQGSCTKRDGRSFPFFVNGFFGF